MSEQIDWSKAPDSAMVLLKHVRDGAYAVAESYSDEAKTWSWPDPRYSFHLMPGMWRVVAERLSTPSWSGEGLPPVGVVCEVAPDNSLWGFSTLEVRKCVVIAYHADFVWLDLFVPGIPVATRVDKVTFRPIRTPEQIAADERESAIKEIEELIAGYSYRHCAELIHDKGYRKP